jgi:hypothetical protein
LAVWRLLSRDGGGQQGEGGYQTLHDGNKMYQETKKGYSTEGKPEERCAGTNSLEKNRRGL